MNTDLVSAWVSQQAADLGIEPEDPSYLSAVEAWREAWRPERVRVLLVAESRAKRHSYVSLWDRRKPERAATYPRRWCNWVLRVAKRPKDPAETRVLEAMHRTALTLRDNSHGILNYFRLRMTSGVIESVNSLAQAARAPAGTATRTPSSR
ncbi:MAG: transposase [Planctomycetes bacterium]|nr:transposase [Planctomycetota bacterium]